MKGNLILYTLFFLTACGGGGGGSGSNESVVSQPPPAPAPAPAPGPTTQVKNFTVRLVGFQMHRISDSNVFAVDVSTMAEEQLSVSD